MHFWKMTPKIGTKNQKMTLSLIIFDDIFVTWMTNLVNEVYLFPFVGSENCKFVTKGKCVQTQIENFGNIIEIRFVLLSTDDERGETDNIFLNDQ